MGVQRESSGGWWSSPQIGGYSLVGLTGRHNYVVHLVFGRHNERERLHFK